MHIILNNQDIFEKEQDGMPWPIRYGELLQSHRKRDMYCCYRDKQTRRTDRELTSDST